MKSVRWELIDVGKPKPLSPLVVCNAEWTRKFLNLADELEMQDAFATLPLYYDAALQWAKDGGIAKDASAALPMGYRSMSVFLTFFSGFLLSFYLVSLYLYLYVFVSLCLIIFSNEEGNGRTC
jgi:hypothetical protein